MLKTIKVFSWIKGHWKLLVAIAGVLLVAYGALQTRRANKWERAHLELKGKLAEQQADQDLLYGEAQQDRAERNVERMKEKEKREELEAGIQEAKKEGEKAKRALAAEKKKTAKLEPTELVEQIIALIGDEVTITTGDLYLFTRTGADRTLNRFLDGEFYLFEYTRLLGEIEDHEAKAASFDTDLKSCDEERVESLEGWDDCRETLATAQQDIVTLEKIKKSGVWRGRKQGAIAVVIIAGGLKLLGIW